MYKPVFATIALAAASTLYGSPQANQAKTPPESTAKPAASAPASNQSSGKHTKTSKKMKKHNNNKKQTNPQGSQTTTH